jgi:hypothetical protein
MGRAKLLLILIFPLCAALLAGRSRTISGHVADADTREPLANVYVRAAGRIVAVTDQSGHYSFRWSDHQQVELDFTLVGYESASMPPSIGIDEETTVSDTIFLVPKPLMIDGITVVAHGARFDRDAPVGTEIIASDELLQSPGSLDDPSRALHILPSVAMVNDYHNDLVVRGGNPAENVVMIEGFEVANINHFGARGTTGGPLGIVPADNVKQITFVPGGFSVRYPNRLSSALLIDLKGANEISTGGKVRADPAGVGCSLNIADPDGHQYLLFTARRSYLEAVESSLNLPAAPRYYDGLLKGGMRINGSTVISLFGLAGVDRFTLPEGAVDWDGGSVDNDQDRGTIGLRLSTLVGCRALLETRYSFDYGFYDASYTEAPWLDASDWSIERSHLLAASLTLAGSGKNELICGVGLKHTEGDYRLHVSSYNDDYHFQHPMLILHDALHANEVNAYLEATTWFDDKTNVVAGLRYDRHSIIHDASICPRVTFSRRLRPNLTISSTIGEFAQPPCLLWLAADSDNRELPYFTANQLILGLEWLLGNTGRLKLEAYRKDYPNYPVAGFPPYVTMLDYGTEFDYYDVRHISADGQGYSRGLELQASSRLLPGLEILFTGSLLTSHYQGASGELAGDFDSDYIVGMLLSYRPISFIWITLRYQGAGGRPYTPIFEAKSAFYGYTIRDYHQLNTEHYPPYQRLDLKAQCDVAGLGGRFSFYVDVLNVLDRQNVYRHYWSETDKKIETLYQFGRLPLFGVLYRW